MVSTTAPSITRSTNPLRIKYMLRPGHPCFSTCSPASCCLCLILCLSLHMMIVTRYGMMWNDNEQCSNTTVITTKAALAWPWTSRGRLNLVQDIHTTRLHQTNACFEWRGVCGVRGERQKAAQASRRGSKQGYSRVVAGGGKAGKAAGEGA